MGGPCPRYVRTLADYIDRRSPIFLASAKYYLIRLFTSLGVFFVCKKILRLNILYTVSMANTLFFYDLETSGFNPRDDRIMQFAGQRTSLDLKHIGEPINVLVKMTDDILPSPDAILVTGITPQSTQQDGLTEPEFCSMLMREVFLPGTTTVGFNNIRFDDEFIRHTLWRNFYDPYEWAWSDERSRWDMLDVARMTRALRPSGIKWPNDSDGKPINKLEVLASTNGLIHEKAHDALSDVEALVGLTELIKSSQPKLFNYLITLRDKKKVSELVSLDSPRAFVYTSGRYEPQYEKTTVAYPIATSTKPGAVLVYDLRFDPKPYLNASPKQLASILFADRAKRQEADFVGLPVKELGFNKCPAVAPLGVLDEDSLSRIGIDLSIIKDHIQTLNSSYDFAGNVRQAFEMREPYESNLDPEHRLYEGFISDQDRARCSVIRAASADELVNLKLRFKDDRLSELFLRYKARHFPNKLVEADQGVWEKYRSDKLKQKLPTYFERLQQLNLAGSDAFILQELQLWAESIAPVET